MSKMLLRRPIILTLHHRVGGPLKTSIRYLRTSVVQQHALDDATCPAAAKNNEPRVLVDRVSWDKAKPFNEMPGPKPLPLIGNTWRFLPYIGEFHGIQNNLIKFFQSMNDRYGDVVRVEGIVGQNRNVQLYNPEDVEMVYKVEGTIPERDILPSLSHFRCTYQQDLFKNARGLLTSQGEEWYDFRTKVNPIMMQPKMVKQYVEPVDEITQEFITKIKRIKGEDNRVKVNFLKEINKWSLESIAFIAMNTKLNCLSDNLTPDSVPFKLINIAEDIFKVGGEIDFQPNLWRYFSTPLYKRAMKIYNEQTVMGQTLIEEAKKRIENKEKSSSYISNNEPSVLEKLLKIDSKVATVMALDMLLAGVDTTSTALVNIFYYLSVNKSKQVKLRQEISSVLPDSSSKLNAQILNSMPYLKACIKEAARLYPVTPGTFRILTKDIVLSGYRIPKGVEILFPHMYLGVKEKHFPKPEEFIPERWLREDTDSELSYKKVHPFCAMHFGFGSRSCIGRRFAELELEIAVINFVRAFNLDWEGPPPMRITTSINYLRGPFTFIFNDIKQ